jgi:hypothetical protein
MEDVPRGTDEWYFAEGIPGQGQRPDWLKPKYNSLAAQAKAYHEAEAKFGSMEAPPDQYDLSTFTDKIDSDNEHIKSFLDYAKESRMSQGQVQKTLESLVNYENSFMVDESKEIEKLGPDGQKKRQIVDQWVSNNFSKEAKETYEILPKTAEVLSFMDEVRQQQAKARSQSPQSTGTADQFKPLTEKEVRNEMAQNHKRYYEDPIYRAEISRKLAQALGDH